MKNRFVLFHSATVNVSYNERGVSFRRHATLIRKILRTHNLYICVLSFVQGFVRKKRINSRQSKMRHNSANKKFETML